MLRSARGGDRPAPARAPRRASTRARPSTALQGRVILAAGGDLDEGADHYRSSETCSACASSSGGVELGVVTEVLDERPRTTSSRSRRPTARASLVPFVDRARRGRPASARPAHGARGAALGARSTSSPCSPRPSTGICAQVHVRTRRELGVELNLWDYRDYTPLRHGQVDDTPYGGGAGMVLRIDVVCAALEAVFGADAATVARDAAGRRAHAHAGVSSTTRSPPSSPAATSACSAAATRASTSAWRISSPTASPSGPTCSPAARSRRRLLLDAVVRKIDGRDRNPDSVVRRVVLAAELEGGGRVPALHAPRRVSRLDRAGRAAVRATTPPDRALAA